MKMTPRLWLIVIYAVMLGAGYGLSLLLPDLTLLKEVILESPAMWGVMVALLLVYVFASAIPFVPGAEIGLGMMLMLGAKVALVVYLCMILALSLAFLAGRLVPATCFARGFRFFGMDRAAVLVLRSDALGYAERTEFLEAHLPQRVVPLLLRYRYLTLALLLNVPGNTLLGGGGGLSFTAGASRVFGVLPFLVTILLAVAPVPLIVVLSGWGL